MLCDILPGFAFEHPRVERFGHCENLGSERTRLNTDRTVDLEIGSLHDGSNVVDPAVSDAPLSYGCREGETTTPTSQRTVRLSSSMVEPCQGRDRVRSLPRSQQVRLAKANGSEDIPNSIRSKKTSFLDVSLAGENARKILWAIFTAFVTLSYPKLSPHVMCVPWELPFSLQQVTKATMEVPTPLGKNLDSW